MNIFEANKKFNEFDMEIKMNIAIGNLCQK